MHTLIKIHPLALHNRALIFSNCDLFSLSQPHHVMAFLPSPYDNHQSMGGQSERWVPSKNGRAKLIQLHMYQGSPRFPVFRAAYKVIPRLPNATFTPSIQANLGLPRTNPPLTSAINTFLAIRYSSILSTCPNHLNPLWSALLANSLSIPALLHTSSFLTLHSRHSNQTSQTRHLKNIHFPSLSTSHTQCLCSNIVGTITPSYRHFLALSPIFYCSGHFSALPKL